MLGLLSRSDCSHSLKACNTLIPEVKVLGNDIYIISLGHANCLYCSQTLLQRARQECSMATSNLEWSMILWRVNSCVQCSHFVCKFDTHPSASTLCLESVFLVDFRLNIYFIQRFHCANVDCMLNWLCNFRDLRRAIWRRLLVCWLSNNYLGWRIAPHLIGLT